MHVALEGKTYNGYMKKTDLFYTLKIKCTPVCSRTRVLTISLADAAHLEGRFCSKVSYVKLMLEVRSETDKYPVSLQDLMGIESR